MTRKELLSVPAREWNEELHGVNSVWLIPSGRKHESGWACMDFVASWQYPENKLVRFGGACDSLELAGDHFVIDCDWPSRIIHIWSQYPFTVEGGISSITLRAEGNSNRRSKPVRKDFGFLWRK